MSIERKRELKLPEGTGDFGSGQLHLDHYFSPLFRWRIFADFIGWGNGCPMAERNIAKEGPKKYAAQHAPLNAIWGFIFQELTPQIEKANPQLYEDIVRGFEVVPESQEYDLVSVPDSYHVDRERYGLARDKAYDLVKKIGDEVIQIVGPVESQAKIPPGKIAQAQAVYFGALGTIEELMQDTTVTTLDELFERFSQTTAEDWRRQMDPPVPETA